MFDLTDILAYTLALGVAVSIPGPGMTALVARSVGSGARTGFAMLGGLIVGDLLYLSFAVFGLAIVANSFSALFTAIRWASISYLLFLAWQFWTATHHDLSGNDNSRNELRSAALTGLAINLGNPKTIAFYLALLPLVLDLNNITFGVWAAVLVPINILVLFAAGAVFILCAIAIRQILSSPIAQKRLHRVAATAMAGAAATMLLQEI